MVHGNLNAEKNYVRSDFAAANMLLVRMIICLGTFLGFTFGWADIKEAFFQSHPIKRQVYVRPPLDFPHDKGELWELFTLPDGMREAGLQWLLTIEEWMKTYYGLGRVVGVRKLFEKRGASKLSGIVERATDEFLISCMVEDVRKFIREL